jgi:ligand-binding sensor domain-containing protein/DNA-binding CsgD family transcriptional regulator
MLTRLIAVYSLLLYLLTLSPVAQSQNTIGLPDIKNYSSQDYHGGTQTWNACQAKNGILYFANNDGLLGYDGSYWRQYAVANRTVVRSILIDSISGNIYVGSQNELGYFAPGPGGDLAYTSLKKLIPEQYRDFADVWHIAITGNAVFFRTNQKIFQFYRDNTVRVYQAPSEWRYMKKNGDRLLAQDRNEGILEFRNNRWEPVCNHPVLKEGLITSILDYRQDTLLVTTLRDGIFLLHGAELTRMPTEPDAVFTSSRIYCAAKVNTDEFAIGTTSAGCYIINTAGKLVQTISRTDGLQNNNILCLFPDNNRNLWIGLDNGIDYVAYNTAIKRILPDKENQLSGYAIRVFNRKLYLGTSDGLYCVPLDLQGKDFSFSKGDFSRVPNTNGQVWRVEELNGQLLMGHHEGTFLIDKDKTVPVLKHTGSWLCAPLPGSGGKTLVAGTYTGLQLFESDGLHFTNRGKIEGLNESLRFLVAESDSVIWSSHPLKGVYRMVLSADKKKLQYKLYTQKDGLPDNFNNCVHFIKGRMVVSTPKGVFEYSPVSDRFIASTVLPGILRGANIQYLNEDAYNNIWFQIDKKIGFIDYSKPANGETFSILYFPELTNKLVRGFEYIYPYDMENIFIGSEKGIYHVNYKNYLQQATQLSILIGRVKAIGKTDSLVYGGYPFNPGKALPALPYSWNSFHFEYSAPFYGHQDNIEYSYQLVGFDDQWSAWTKKSEKDYTNLSSGKYTFLVKSRTNLGNESQPVSYPFEISPPWYQTVWAYLFYLVVLIMGLYAYARWQRKQFAAQQQQSVKEQEHLRYMHQLETERNEKEIVKLQNDKLATDVDYKNRELASATMHLVERGKVLATIKEELMRLEKTTMAQGQQVDFSRVINILSGVEKNDNYWEQFVSHFDQVYSNYLTVLKARYPSLSATDLKLCAYLRMNLSSKEISQLMNISVRSVEIARYRLRKKLQLVTDENLSDFLIGIRIDH